MSSPTADPTAVSTALATLSASLNGRVIGPDDPGYDQGRTLFYGGMDRRPAAIVRPADADDVARVVTLAAETGADLSVKCGGHSTAGHSVVDGGIVLDLADMQALEIDPDGGIAWAQTGLTAAAYTTQAAAHGLATGFGDTGSVGIGGITLSGGIGFLHRKHGLTIDNLLAAEVVTADGRLLHADADNHPDLFWALRGGGGNFGVATRFRFRLHPLEQVVGGMLLLPATPETIAGFVAAAEAAPDELSTIGSVMPAPPMPFVPAEAHGKLVIMGLVCYAGAADDGQRALAPFRALAEPVADLVRPMPYPGMYQPEEEGFHPLGAGHTMFVDTVDDRAAALIIERLQAGTAPMRAVQLRVLGGAMGRVPADATAFAHRGQRIMVNVGALYMRPDEKATHEAWVAGFAQALRDGWGRPGVYVGFLGDEGEDRVREAYPGPTWERLAAVKATYDPTNLFRHTQNVPPAS